MGNSISNFIEDVSGQTRRRLVKKEIALVQKETALAERGIALAEKEIALAEKETALAERRIALAEKETALARKRLAETRSQTNGSFYSKIDDVLAPQLEQFDVRDFNALRRSSPHPFYKGIISYAEADPALLRPAYDSTRSEFASRSDASSLHTYHDDTSTHRTGKRRLRNHAIDGAEYNTGKIAHLIPYDASCSNAYLALAEALTGVNFSESPCGVPTKKRKVLVHGQYKAKVTDSDIPSRVPGSGLKHCCKNMARIVGQRENMDVYPGMLILPILSLEETLKYEGGSYSVLVLGKDKDVYQASILIKSYDQCTRDEVNTAVSTLAQFVKGVAATLVDLPDDVISKIKPDIEKEAIQEVYNRLRKTPKVNVPSLIQETTAWRMKVIKLPFSNSEAKTHQETDPFLLYMKAAVVWSAKNGEKLLPVCAFLGGGCEECAENGLLECECEAFDPCEIPREVVVTIDEHEVLE